MANPDTFTDMHFPRAGIDLSSAFMRQPNKAVDHKSDYARTCPVGVNVRGFDAIGQRGRGGSRPGLRKYIAQVVVADWIIQELALLVGSGYAPPGGTMQTSQSGRVVTVVAVSQGNVYTANAGDAVWTSPTNNTGDTPPLSYTGIIYSAPNNQKLYFADGTNWVYYDPSVNTVYRWSPTAGALPVDSLNNTPRLICTWRGRTVLSGLLDDPHNWFMSAVNEPTDFDYLPVDFSPTQAVAGNNSRAGLVGDVVTGLIPYSDDVLIFLGDSTIWMMNGDPVAGGQIDLISDSIGGAWGVAWCKDPYGTLYFFSNKTGIYSLVPGQLPQRISQQIEQLVNSINTGDNAIRMSWDDRFQGLHVFVTPLAAPAASTHFFWEWRTGAWWTDTFGNTNHSPLTLCVFDGNLPGDRCVLLGSWDGYVRTLSPSSTDDDGTAISSSVVIGPLNTKDLDEILLKDIQGILGSTSGSVAYSVYVGATAELALASGAVSSGTFAAGRNLLSPVRRSGHGIYVKITATSQWAIEAIRARVATQGKIRRRGA